MPPGIERPSLATPRVLWECYASAEAGILDKSCHATLDGLKNKTELNLEQVKIVNWDGLSHCFMVMVEQSGQHIKAKPCYLRSSCAGYDCSSWAVSDAQLGCLPQDVALNVAYWLPVRIVAALSGASRTFRSALWLQADSAHLWESLARRSLGEEAAGTAKRLRPGVQGAVLFRTARAARYLWKSAFRVKGGGVHRETGNAEVVACPCLRHLTNAGVGAQGAIRRRAGKVLEDAVAKLEIPVPELSVTLVPGGEVAKYVAMTVTEPPARVLVRVRQQDQARVIMSWLDEIHMNLLQEVRKAGLRSVAMPTLCTGGFGVPPHFVAIAAVRALRNDFFAHLDDPLQVQVSCFECTHIPVVETMRDEVYEKLYTPNCVDSLQEHALAPDSVSDSESSLG
mmetsp:Transcript_42324/g.76780  ORF Transcript_42324/g.76780 Transcript_42324/m.76780 type:complete len:396 (+) Transcript_42324:67-1254(+)